MCDDGVSVIFDIGRDCGRVCSKCILIAPQTIRRNDKAFLLLRAVCDNRKFWHKSILTFSSDTADSLTLVHGIDCAQDSRMYCLWGSRHYLVIVCVSSIHPSLALYSRVLSTFLYMARWLVLKCYPRGCQMGINGFFRGGQGLEAKKPTKCEQSTSFVVLLLNWGFSLAYETTTNGTTSHNNFFWKVKPWGWSVLISSMTLGGFRLVNFRIWDTDLEGYMLRHAIAFTHRTGIGWICFYTSIISRSSALVEVYTLCSNPHVIQGYS